MDTYTYDQMIAIFDKSAVDKLNEENCEMTNSFFDGDAEYMEFTADIKAVNFWNGEECRIRAIYHQLQSALDAVEDLDQLTWTVEYYDII